MGAAKADLITNVTATASDWTGGYDAIHAVDKSGLDAATPFPNHRYVGSGGHYTETYLSNNNQTPTLIFNLGGIKTLDSIHIWNYNDGRTGNAVTGGDFGSYTNFGRGIHSVDILLSSTDTNEASFTTWKSGVIFTDAPGSDTYTGFDLATVTDSIAGQSARYVKFKVNNNWSDGKDSHGAYTGLAEIQFFEGTGVSAPTIRYGNPAVSNITVNTAWLNGTLTSTGSAPTTVSVYWGPTDAGTNSAWAHTNVFTGTATVVPSNYTFQATTAAGSINYFNYYAQNASGGVWAVSSGGAEQFVTLDVPGVDNFGWASDIGVLSATIHGRITHSRANVYLCWGTNNAGISDPGAWNHVEPMGWLTATTPVSKSISNLTSGATYYYTTYASNGVGTAWAGVTNFATQVASPNLAPDDPRISYSDYARLVTLNSSTARFDRIIVGAKGSLERANPAARMRIRTDATNITTSFITGALGITSGIGVILVDGVKTGTFDASANNSALDVKLTLGGGFHTIEYLMPYSQDVRFTGLVANPTAAFEAVPPRPGIRWVAYGDSITEGFLASDSFKNYLSLVGAAKNWEVVNMGFGWRGLKDSGSGGSDGTVIGGLGASIITVLMGYNDAAAGLTAADYRTNLTALVNQVRLASPKIPIYLISPIYTANNQSLLASYRTQIMNDVATANDSRLFFIDGLALGINAGNAGMYLSDGIHPNDAGFAVIAANLGPQLSLSRGAAQGTVVVVR